jgi:hypothetical protein
MDNADPTAHRDGLLEATHNHAHAVESHQAIGSVLGLKLEGVQLVRAKDPPQVRQTIKKQSKNARVQSSRRMTSPVVAPYGHYYKQSCLEEHPSSERVMLSPKKKAKTSETCREICYTQDTPQLNTLPTFIYSYTGHTDQLHRTSLSTGEQSTYRVRSYTFNYGCCWSEVPGGSLLITGGEDEACSPRKEVVRIDTRREFGVSQLPSMLTPREWHAAVYHAPHLYVLGGLNDSGHLSECERYVCADNRWQTLPDLPRACGNTSGVVVESSLYALGGHADGLRLDLVQKLSLESLTWELMQLRLPHVGRGIPCFKLRDTEVYLVVKKTLCFFTALQVHPLKTLTEDIWSWCGASYYHRGTLYCSSDEGAVLSYEIGSLGN